MKLLPFNDPIGNAVIAFYTSNDSTSIEIISSAFDRDELQPDYFFRNYDEMPKLEQIALRISEGKILDIGAGAGAHSLFLQEKGFDITALEMSSLCCAVMQKRGVEKVINEDIFSYTNSNKFDTILLLMNGIGIAGTPKGLEQLLKKIKNVLTPSGQILLDSSDLIYLYEQENGSVLFDINAETYYGQIDFLLRYKNIEGEPFNWLYADQVLLSDLASTVGLKTEIIEYGEHYDYLAKLTLL